MIQIQIKLRWALFVTYTIIQSIMRSEMCSLHLTHPTAHTWSSGQPTVQRPGSSRGPPAGAGMRTHNLGLPRVSSPTLYPLGHDCLIYSHIIETKMMLYKIDFKIENRQIIYLTEHKLETCQQQTGRTQEHNHQFIRMPCTAGWQQVTVPL